jgi:hypothetical protein
MAPITELTNDFDIDGNSSMNALLVHCCSGWTALRAGAAGALLEGHNPPNGIRGCQVE